MKKLILIFCLMVTLTCHQSAVRPTVIPESRAKQFYENASVQFAIYENTSYATKLEQPDGFMKDMIDFPGIVTSHQDR